MFSSCKVAPLSISSSLFCRSHSTCYVRLLGQLNAHCDFIRRFSRMKIPSALVLAALFSSTTCPIPGIAQVDTPVERKHPVLMGPSTGGTRDVTGSNDAQVLDVTQFAKTHLESQNSGLHFIQYKVEVQVVAGLKYTLYFSGNDDEGCQENRKVVVYDKPWMKTREVESDEVLPCA